MDEGMTLILVAVLGSDTKDTLATKYPVTEDGKFSNSVQNFIMVGLVDGNGVFLHYLPDQPLKEDPPIEKKKANLILMSNKRKGVKNARK